MTKSKKDNLQKAGFKIGSAWDVVGMTAEEAKKAETNYQKIKQNRR